MNEEQNLIRKLSKFCMRGEKCEEDIRKKMQHWKVEKQEQEKIIDLLKNEDFINHKRYAQAFVNDKIKFHHWGKQKIKAYLKNKKIEEKVIEMALNKIPQKLYEDILTTELQKKMNSLSEMPEIKKKEKVVNYLLQKGFEYGKVFDFVENEIKKD